MGMEVILLLDLFFWGCVASFCCRPKEKEKESLRAIIGVAALVGLGTLVGVAVTLANGGPTALMDAIAKSGFSAAFALIFVSEIGDKVYIVVCIHSVNHNWSSMNKILQYAEITICLGKQQYAIFLCNIWWNITPSTPNFKMLNWWWWWWCV